jgi:predicted GNAT family N-acyltransferase
MICRSDELRKPDPLRIEIFSVADAARLARAIAVRVAVFVDEQRVPLDEEIDAHDRPGAVAVHALAVDDASDLGAGRSFARDATTVQIGRMAVLASARRRGVGAAVLEHLLAEARGSGFARARLDAQEHAIGFYERAGFVVVGAPVLDVGIVHRAMERSL